MKHSSIQSELGGMISHSPTNQTSPATTPIFFYDGDFRTWKQVERRAQLNKAIATYVQTYPVR